MCALLAALAGEVARRLVPADANPNIDLDTQSGWDTIYNALLAALEA